MSSDIMRMILGRAVLGGSVARALGTGAATSRTANAAKAVLIMAGVPMAEFQEAVYLAPSTWASKTRTFSQLPECFWRKAAWSS